MASDEATMRKAAETLQAKMVGFMETLNPEEQQILSRTLRAAAEQAAMAQGADVEGYAGTSYPTVYFFYWTW